jgi:hypothetical protein
MSFKWLAPAGRSVTSILEAWLRAANDTRGGIECLIRRREGSPDFHGVKSGAEVMGGGLRATNDQFRMFYCIDPTGEK